MPNPKIINLTNGCGYKRRAAERAIEECSAVWVVEGVSIRSLTLQESIAARNRQAQLRERLEYAELPWLRYEPTQNGIPAKRREGRLLWQAHQFASAAAA